LRDFGLPPRSEDNPFHVAAKSALDPSREMVWRRTMAAGATSLSEWPLFLKETEPLDGISTLKRIKGIVDTASQTPSTSLMAARAVLPTIAQNAPDALHALEAIAKATHGAMDIGDLLFPERVIEELRAEPNLLDATVQEQVKIQRAKALKALTSDPETLGIEATPPYYALLLADGDRMGQIIGSAGNNSADRHRQFSLALSQWAVAAKATVREMEGHCIYAGGDDCLAMLPVTRAIDCAQRLSDSFADTMQPFVDQTASTVTASPSGGTLSVGIVFVHYKEPLLGSLVRVREAEHLAKKERNSLAVVYHSRGGQPTAVSSSWHDTDDERDDAGKVAVAAKWGKWERCYRDSQLSRGFAYELRQLAREFDAPEEIPLPRHRLQAEAERILARKEPEGKATGLRPILPSVNSVERLRQFANLLVIARFLSRDGYEKE
jgi:hypothetical protein